MATVNEKIEEIKQRFRKLGYINEAEITEMSLIVINEVIDQWEYVDTYISNLGGKLNPNLKYWYEVKKRINT